MNASVLKHEIETLLGLTGARAADFWRAAVVSSRQPSAPTPVPIPYPNINAGTPVAVQGVGSRFDGQYVLTRVRHQVSQSGYQNRFTCIPDAVQGDQNVLTYGNLFACISAAVSGDQAAHRVWPVWLQVKREFGRYSTQDRNALGHELTHTLQQRGGRH